MRSALDQQAQAAQAAPAQPRLGLSLVEVGGAVAVDGKAGKGKAKAAGKAAKGAKSQKAASDDGGYGGKTTNVKCGKVKGKTASADGGYGSKDKLGKVKGQKDKGKGASKSDMAKTKMPSKASQRLDALKTDGLPLTRLVRVD